MDYLTVLYTGETIQAVALKAGANVSIGDSDNDKLKLTGHGESCLTLNSVSGGVHVLSRFAVQIAKDKFTNRILSAGDALNISEQVTLAVFDGRCDASGGLSLDTFDEIRIGRSLNNHICLKGLQVSSRHARLYKTNKDTWRIEDLGSRNGIFVNGKLLKSPEDLKEDSLVFIGGFLFFIRNNCLIFRNTPGDIRFSPSLTRYLIPVSTRTRSYPFFQRSPRLRSKLESEEIEVLSPPNASSKPQISWPQVFLTPCTMILVMIGVALMTKNMTTLMYTLPMSGMGMIVAVINYKSQMKKWKQSQELIRIKYSEHLKEKEQEIINSESEFISALSSSSPGVRECISMAEYVNRRLWERIPGDDDFLDARLGTGQRNSNVRIKIPSEKLVLEENPFIKQAGELRSRHEILTGVPVCHSFMDSSITGLVGSRESVIRTSQRIILDIATHHSYEDVKIICVYPENEKSEWEWLRWLPHVWNSGRTKRFIACKPEQARPMLREIAEILKVRRREVTDRDAIPPTPFYFLLFADKSLVESSGEDFLPEASNLGFAALYALGDLGSLPGECQSVITCGNSGRIESTQIDAANNNDIYFSPDYVQTDWLDEFSRSLAPVRLRTSGSKAAMPAYIPFLQGLGVNKVEELDVLGRWERGKPFKSIASPIGIKENGEVFYFDIHEKGMGPHGIAAGATRWGKSETLTTWLLSVALHYKPDEVSFVLIDFKGDGLSGILMDLPHVSGVISNVDDITSIERNLRSLRGELIRRQRVFKETKLENIHKYQEARRNGRELESLPYLIVVIDEFAELKTQFPEQMDEFISIARVGGSLGVYMVLATQSPGGIVAGQVSANSRFRICLKTAEAGESKEILGTTDAFQITVRGRAYVKVGNNEVYEQVQTFYSKAPYQPESGKKGPSKIINMIELNGDRIRPEIYDKTVGAKGEDLGEGRAISSYIRAETLKHNLPFARAVWTEALPKQLPLDELISGKEAFKNNSWESCNSGFSVVVGRIDDPEAQCQYPFVLDFMRDGHQILYGAPSSGKTTFLQTVLFSAALSYTPEQLNFLVLDFGTFGLKIFENLPHALMVAAPDDSEKLEKAKSFLANEINNRKQLFASHGVGTLEAYCDVSGKKLPSILVAVDNMASLYSQNSDMMDILIQTAREGGGLGIYLILTAGSSGSFMFRIAQYVKSNHALQMTEKSEYRSIVGGNGKMEPTHVAGRGLTKGPLEFQTALSTRGSTEGERVKQLRDTCVLMSSAWLGKRASLEEREKEIAAADAADVDTSKLSSTQYAVQIGLDKSSRDPVDFIFTNMNGCIITGPENTGKSNLLAMIVKTLSQDTDTDLYICEEKSYLEKIKPDSKIAHDSAGIDAMISELADEFDRRSENDEGKFRRIVFCIDDFLVFYRGMSQESADILDNLITGGSGFGIYIYIASGIKDVALMHTCRIKPFENCLSKGNVVITGGNLKDSDAFNNLHNQENIAFTGRDGCMIHDGKVVMLKFAKAEVE